MSMPSVGSVSRPGAAGGPGLAEGLGPERRAERFRAELEGAAPEAGPGAPAGAAPGRAVTVVPSREVESQRVAAGPVVHGGRTAAPVAPVRAPASVQMVEQVVAAQRRLEQVLVQARSGKSFTPAELLALQAHVYRASQELDLAGKVVEKAAGGVKQVLQTQV